MFKGGQSREEACQGVGLGTILPLIERAGVATADEVDITTLQDRLASELMGANAVLAHPTLYCAWARHD